MTAAGQGTPFAIAVSVGTDHHEFNRLVSWVYGWVQEQPFDVSVFMQTGFTPVGPSPRVQARTADFVAHDELLKEFARSDAVVLQGGPGGIMAARSVGRLPIVVPRRRDLGEHVDDHQVVFARAMAGAGRIICCETGAELATVLTDIVAGTVDVVIPEGTGGATDAARAVEESITAPRLTGKSVLRRARFSLRRAGDHRFRA